MKLRLHFVVDPAGWLCVSLVLAVWFYNTVVVPKLVLLPHYREGHISWAVIACECCRRRRGGSLQASGRLTLVCLQVITRRRRSAWPPCSGPPPPTRDASPRTPTYLTQVRAPR